MLYYQRYYLICFTTLHRLRLTQKTCKSWPSPCLDWPLPGLGADTRCWFSKFCIECWQTNSQCSLIPQRDAPTPTPLYHPDTSRMRAGSRSRLRDLSSLHEGASRVNYKNCVVCPFFFLLQPLWLEVGVPLCVLDGKGITSLSLFLISDYPEVWNKCE